MELITQKPNYSIAGGDHNFDAVQIIQPKVTVQVFYSNIAVSDVQLELHQSTSGTGFDLVPNSNVTVDKTAPSHCWNVIGLTPGVFLRVAVKKGTAAAGTIDKINLLNG